MTTEALYTKHAAEIMAWVDENRTEPFSIERKWVEEQLANKLQLVTDLAADEDDAAYQAGYDTGYDDGYDKAKEEMASEIEDLESKVEELETQTEELEAEIRDLEEQAADAFAQGYETATKDGDSVQTLELS